MFRSSLGGKDLSGKAKSPDGRPGVSQAWFSTIYNVLFGLRAGAAIVLMDRFDPVDFATLVARHGMPDIRLLYDSDVRFLSQFAR
mgnify:CR=1 FL=1